MINKIISTLRLIEAQYIYNAKKNNSLFLYLLRLLFLCIVIQLFYFIPIFFIPKYFPASIIMSGVIALLSFSFFLYRVIILSRKNLEDMISHYKKDRDSLVTLLTTRIHINLTICVIIFILTLLYFILIYGLFSLFSSTSLLHFSVSLVGIGVVSSTVISIIFLSPFYKNNRLLWPKVLLPIVSVILLCIILILVNLFFPINFSLGYILCFTGLWVCSFPLLKKLLPHTKLIIAFRFTLFCYFVIILLFLITSYNIDDIFSFSMNDHSYIQPVSMVLYNFFYFIKHEFIYNTTFILIFPHFFNLFVIGITIVCDMFYVLRKKNLLRTLTIQNDDELIFSTSLSLYPLLWVLFRSFVIAGLLFLEITPLTDTINALLSTFKIKDIFHLTFLTIDNILFTFTFIWYLITIILGLQCIDKIIMHLFSTCSLLTGEFIYKEIRLLSKIVIRIPVKKIHYAIYHQHIYERLFNSGTLHIETPDKSGIVTIKHIPCLKENYNTLMTKVKSDS